MRHESPFDWRGFAFFIKLIAVLAIVAAGGYWGYEYTAGRLESSPATLVSLQAQASTTTTPVRFPTSQRIIRSLSIEQAVPQEGRFIVADLTAMKLHLYESGIATATYPIQTKGKPGTPWETPSGFYSIKTKEESHFSTIGRVFMPFSMQFYGNYFIHGSTYYPDGSPTAATFSGGCIKLTTQDAKEVFAFAELGTGVFVYDEKEKASLPPLELGPLSKPTVDAAAYLVADLDTGDVYAERNAQVQRPIASITKLMTALVANETISLDKKVQVEEGALSNPPVPASTTPKVFLVNDLFYPLLMQSSNGVAKALADYYGERQFVRWMNATAKSLDMASTAFADASGISPDNVSTTDDLFRLAAYLAHKKSFVFKITSAETKTIAAEDGASFEVKNVNAPAFLKPFEGGKAGKTTAAGETMVTIYPITTPEATRHIAIIVLGSSDQIRDTQALADWINGAVAYAQYQAACTSCSDADLRQIDL